MEAGNKKEVSRILKQYKAPNGEPNYPILFDIPRDQRIAALADRDYERINLLIVGALTMALENMNVKRGLNAIQILNLSELIIETAEEGDSLSFEDLMLFLQKMVKGEYEMSYESMDLPKFMKLLRQYRDERWNVGRNMVLDLQQQYKCMGDPGKTYQKNDLAERFGEMAGKLSELKSSLREKTHENNVLNQANKFYKDK
jgi:hypothetical protein